MKNLTSKKLNKKIETVCDFKGENLRGFSDTTPPETDPTTVTATIVLTTINTHLVGQKLTA